MKKQYEYNVDGITVSTREAARLIQRSFRLTSPPEVKAPKITQKVVIERVIR